MGSGGSFFAYEVYKLVVIDMAIKLKHQELNNPVEQMLQGITCLMAYKDCIQNRDSYEAEFVVAACEILNSYLGRKDYSVVMEYPYRNIVGGKTRKEADLVVIRKTHDKDEKGHVLCVMEFKMSTDTNGGVEKDVEKLKSLPTGIDRLSVLLFLKPNDGLRRQYVTDSFIADRNVSSLKANKDLKQDTNIRIRRVTKVLRSKKSKRDPYMAVCIEV